jgi:drug/metabolite transporter (DMT)-like permease
MIGVLGLASQYLVFAANTLMKPSNMMPFGYASVATGFIADMYIFDTTIGLIPAIGIILTSTGLLGEFFLASQEPIHSFSQALSNMESSQKKEERPADKIDT